MKGVTWDGAWDDKSIDWTRLHEPRHHFEIVDELHARGLVRVPSEAHRRSFASVTASVLEACGPHTLPTFRRAVARMLAQARCGGDNNVYVIPLSCIDPTNLNPRSPTRVCLNNRKCECAS